MFKVLDEVCKPTKGSKYSACIDLYAREDVVIGAGETVKVPLGVCIDEDKILMSIEDKRHGITREQHKFDFMKSHYLALHPRSSLRVKGLIANTGIIDLDYRDEIMMVVHNPIKAYAKCDAMSCDWTFGNELRFIGDYIINEGDKVAQIMLCEHKTYLIGVDTEEERSGGFGSTGQ